MNIDKLLGSGAVNFAKRFLGVFAEEHVDYLIKQLESSKSGQIVLLETGSVAGERAIEGLTAVLKFVAEDTFKVEMVIARSQTVKGKNHCFLIIYKRGTDFVYPRVGQ